MAIRYEDPEERKRVAIEALKSTGAKRVFAEEAAPAVAAVPATRKRERRLAVAPAPAKTAETRFDRKAYQKVYMKAYMRGWRARKASERVGAGYRPPGDPHQFSAWPGRSSDG